MFRSWHPLFSRVKALQNASENLTHIQLTSVGAKPEQAERGRGFLSQAFSCCSPVARIGQEDSRSLGYIYLCILQYFINHYLARIGLWDCILMGLIKTPPVLLIMSRLSHEKTCSVSLIAFLDWVKYTHYFRLVLIIKWWSWPSSWHIILHESSTPSWREVHWTISTQLGFLLWCSVFIKSAPSHIYLSTQYLPTYTCDQV